MEVFLCDSFALALSCMLMADSKMHLITSIFLLSCPYISVEETLGSIWSVKCEENLWISGRVTVT